MAESYFMVYIIERRGPRQRVFGPVPGHGAFGTKREALQKCRELTKKRRRTNTEPEVIGTNVLGKLCAAT